MPKVDFSKLKALLNEQETFPHLFTLKFIGKNSSEFQEGVRKFESEYHPALQLRSRRESSARSHLALTYTLLVQTADEAANALKRISVIEDVQIIL